MNRPADRDSQHRLGRALRRALSAVQPQPRAVLWVLGVVAAYAIGFTVAKLFTSGQGESAAMVALAVTLVVLCVLGWGMANIGHDADATKRDEG